MHVSDAPCMHHAMHAPENWLGLHGCLLATMHAECQHQHPFRPCTRVQAPLAQLAHPCTASSSLCCFRGLLTHILRVVLHPEPVAQQVMKEDDNNWPVPDRVGRQELEVIVGNDHVSYTCTKLGSVLQVQQSKDPEGLRIFYYLVQVSPFCDGGGSEGTRAVDGHGMDSIKGSEPGRAWGNGSCRYRPPGTQH